MAGKFRTHLPSLLCSSLVRIEALLHCLLALPLHLHGTWLV